MKIFSGKRNKKGFTLTEILMAVAILVVAMALIIPGIIGMSENLEITRLDNIAKEIYTAAQSRAVSLSVSGQLGQVGGTEIKEGETSTGYKYVCKSGEDSSGTDMLLPLGSIDENVRLNYYIIEYNPKTAMIRSVYYWEDKGNNFHTDAYGESGSKDKEFRKGYKDGMVGYYDGESTSPAGDRLDYNGSVGAELVNDEELYLKIEQRKDTTNGTTLNGTFTVTLTDLVTKKSMEIPSFENGVQDNMPENLVKEISGTNTYFKLILDSLDPKLRFSKIMSGYKQGKTELNDAFQPGCDLRVTVSYKEGNKVQEESFLTNSLFESVKEEGDEKTAYIACGRHLQNLSLPWVYPDGVKNTDTLSGVKKAVQTKEIDWIVSLTKVFKDINKLSSFIPIVNGNLDEFDGGGNAISHMGIFGNLTEYLGDELGIGLFSTFEGNKLENVKLVDCTVKELTGNNLQVGLLAGIVNNSESSGCTVSNCVAYAKVDKANPVKEDQCSIDVPTGANSVGGLFGTVKNTKIEKCSASLTKITGGTYVGGLVGSFDCGESQIDISKCYADTGTCNSERTGWQSGLSGYIVGGLLGNISGSNEFKMEYSYAVGYVSDDKNAACGLVGSSSNTGNKTINYCYAALMKENDFVDDLVPDGLGGTDCINYNGIYSCFDSLLNINTGKPYIKGSANTTNPYGLFETSETSTQNTASYPFPKLENMPHYGDWPREGLGVLMAYFELYRNESGQYSIGFFNDELFKNDDKKYNQGYDLKDDDEHTVVMDGYAVMLPVEVKEGKAIYGTIDVENELLKKNANKERLIVKYNDESVKTDELRLMNADDKFNKGKVKVWPTNINNNENWIGIKIGDNTTVSYYPLFLSSAMMVEGDSPENDNDGVNGYADHNFYYQKLEVEIKSKDTGTGGTTGGTGTKTENTSVIKVWFNPYVAKSEFVKVEKDKTTGKDEKPANDKLPKESIMRTSRQITAYSYDAMQNAASGKTNGPHTLRLERDISLDKPFMTDSTGPKAESAANGNECKCRNLSFPADSNVILELNGKTLTGKDKDSTENEEENSARVVTCLGGKLEIYGINKDTTGKDSTQNGTLKGGGIFMSGEGTCKLKDVNIVYIKNSTADGSSVSIEVSGGVTMEGCTITETEPETDPAA